MTFVMFTSGNGRALPPNNGLGKSLLSAARRSIIGNAAMIGTIWPRWKSAVIVLGDDAADLVPGRPPCAGNLLAKNKIVFDEAIREKVH